MISDGRSDEDRLSELERRREEDYFLERDRLLIEQLRRAEGEKAQLLLREIAKARCPSCGCRLEPATVAGISVDECLGCRAVWVDRGELQVLEPGRNAEPPSEPPASSDA